MFYTTEEAAIVCGFLDLYLNRDSVDRGARITGGQKRRWTFSSHAGGSRMRIIERCKTRC